MILLDTHVVLWLTSEPEKLSHDARAAIENERKAGEGLAVCDVTLLELTSSVAKGRIRLGISLESFLEDLEKRFVILSITGSACARIQQLPISYPKDPADRIIAATALTKGLRLVTADREIRQSKAVPTIW